MSAATIDLSPLVPLVNDLIAYVLVPVAGAAITIASGFLVQFLLRHGWLQNQQRAAIAQQQISSFADRLVTYNAASLEKMVPESLIVAAPNKAIATLANYAISQVPETLKQAGIDPRSTDGQSKLVRLITARLDATPPVTPPAMAQLPPR